MSAPVYPTSSNEVEQGTVVVGGAMEVVVSAAKVVVEAVCSREPASDVVVEAGRV